MNSGKRLRTARIARGLSLGSAAQRLHVSPVSLFLWEYNLTKPTNRVVRQMAQLYKFKPTPILRVSEEQPARATRTQKILRVSLALVILLLLLFRWVPAIKYLGIVIIAILVALLPAPKPTPVPGKLTDETEANRPFKNLALLVLLTPTILRAPNWDSWTLLVALVVVYVFIHVGQIRQFVARK